MTWPAASFGTAQFVDQLAGALNVSASDVKTQVEFNPQRVTSWRQIGYAKHRLRKEQFRDNTVDAAELGAAEAGNGLYVVSPADGRIVAVEKARDEQAKAAAAGAARPAKATKPRGTQR